MEVVEFKVRGRQEVDLACIKVLPKKEPKAIVQIFHGMGEYKNRYIPFMKYLAQNGFASYAHDHRKHGESIKVEEGYGMFDKTDNWDSFIDDCYFVSRQILKENPGKKIIILGHSMGSIIGRSFIARYNTIPYAFIMMGSIAPMSGSQLMAFQLISKIMNLFSGSKRSQFLADKISEPLWKNVEGFKTKFDWLSYNEDNVNAYIDDPLCGYAYTPRFYSEFAKGVKQSQNTNVISEGKDIPILIISGIDDPVGGEKGEGVKKVRELYDGHGMTQLKLKLVEGSKHEVLHENNKEETYKFILDWLVSVL